MTAPVVLDAAGRMRYVYHRDPAVVCAYTCRHGPWRCAGCGRAQLPGAWRYWRHDADVCDPDDGQGLCYNGPYCPHCAELL